MKLPSLQDLKRHGIQTLRPGFKHDLDPSAVERGLQYLRDGGFLGMEINTLGAKGFQLEFQLKDSQQKTVVDLTNPTQPIYSSCDCSMSGYGIFCKHQAIATWVLTCLASQNFELVRVPEVEIEKMKGLLPQFERLRTGTKVAPVLDEAPIIDTTLKGLIFCLPVDSLQAGGRPLLNPMDPSIEPVSLGETRLDSQRLLPNLSLSFYRENDLPHPLWRSPLSFRGTSSPIPQSPVEDQRRKSIWYLFENGIRIPISEILFHPLARCVPAEILPVSGQLDTEFASQRKLFPQVKGTGEATQVYWDPRHDQRLDQILMAVCGQISRFVRHGRFQIYLSTVDQLDLSGKAYEIESIDFSVPEDLGSGIAVRASSEFPATYRLDLELAPQPWQWARAWAWNPVTKTLLFHPFFAWLERYPTPLELGSHGQMETLLEESRTKLGLTHTEIFTVPKSEFRSSENLQPSVRIHSSGGFSVEIEVSPEAPSSQNGLIADGIPLRIRQHLQVLTEGIRAWQPEKSEEIFDSKKQPKRSNDLRLMRHIGIAAVIFSETISNLKRGTVATVGTTTPFFELLKTRCAQLLTKLEGSPAQASPNLEFFCSKNAIEYMAEYVRSLEDLYREASLPILTNHQSLKITGAYRLYLRMIQAWALWVQNQSQGAVLLKTKDGTIQNSSFDQPEKLPDLVVYPSDQRLERQKQSTRWIFSVRDSNSENLIRAFLPLQADGFNVLLDDQEIEEISDQDFVSEFLLKENTDEHGRIDWFELHPTFFFKGVEIPAEQARALSESGMLSFRGKVYRLPPNSIPSIDKLSKFWDQLALNNSPKRGKAKIDRIYRLPRHYTLELLALRSNGVRVKGGKLWDEICHFYDSLGKERDPLHLPLTFLGELKPYQHRGVQWVMDLYRLGMGGILADDMGLGKTVQTLVFLELLRSKNELHHSMIVVPTSLTYNWLSELKRFTPELPGLIFQSKEMKQTQDFLDQNPHGVLITTYGLLAEHEAFFSKHRWNVHIYDEAQNLKTITAKRTTVSRKIAARFKLCLTGTPLENHLGEFYSLMDLVVPGSLGTFDQFRKSYLQAYAPPPEQVQFLKLKTRPLVLRRTKSTILKELPEKTESTIRIPFTEKQLAIYRDIALSWNNKVRSAIHTGGESKSQLIMLTALLRLRQACSAPGSIPNVTYNEVPPKISLLVDNLSAIMESGESALVFTQFLGTFEILEREFNKAGIPYFSLHGKVSRKERENQLQKFQEHQNGAVMLMTLKTGGVGLNLTKASYVFHLEPWWNPAVENQATDRTHRIGQTKPVQVYRYIMSESVEEKIEILKSRKSSQFNALFSDVETEVDIQSGSLHLSQKDFEYLLGV